MNNSDIHVALTFDEKFWAPAYATMRSVCLTTRRRSDLVFHVCYPGLSMEAIAMLDKIGSEFGAKIVHHNIEEDSNYQHFSSSLPHTKYISAVTYARMIFDDIIHKSVSRLVYLDCDLLVRGPIEVLANTDLEGRPLGAVKDSYAMRFSNGRDVACNYDLLDPADPYFNAGVLVIDLEAWRKLDMVKILLALERDKTLPRLVNDQQILNHLFANNWTQLDGVWNMIATSRAIEAMDPQIVHYTGPNKPWNLISGLPFARIYRHVMTNDLYYRYMRLRWRWKIFGLKKV